MKKFLRILSAIIIIYLSSVLFSRVISYNLMVDIHSIQNTIIDARNTAREVELTGVTQQILDYNKKLAELQKLARNPLFVLHFPQGFAYLQPIK